MSAREDIHSSPGLVTLLSLSRSRLAGEAPFRSAASFEGVMKRAEAQALARKRRVRAAYGLSLVAVLALVAFAWLPREPELTYRIDTGVLDAQGRVLGGTKGASIHFSDGSHVALEPGAQTLVESVSARGGRVRIERGSARVAIAKRPHADWAFEAGPYVVQVTGTSFNVSWSASERSLDIAMESGSVVVRGPLLREDLRLEKGQRLSLVLPKQSVTVEDLGSPKALTPAPVGPPAVAEAPHAKAAAKPNTAKGDPARQTWTEYVAQGNFAAVLEEAEKRGLERTLSHASAAELSALADAARYGRRSDIAMRALLSQRRRFPGTPVAERAAFFLGQLSERRGGAIEWYDRYLRESPKGSYVPQALGRKLMLMHEQGGTASASPLAEEYLRRYPNGPYAAAAKKILSDTPAARGVRTPLGR